MAKDKQFSNIISITLMRKQNLSSSFVRLTFSGADVKYIHACQPDQWIKLVFPEGEEKFADFSKIAAELYYKIPSKLRPPMRNYTIRHLRPEMNEIDIDFVIHGDGGPASAWAIHSKIGDKVLISANFLYPNQDEQALIAAGSFVWSPPHFVQEVLLMADETAIPAAIGILEKLAGYNRPPLVHAYFEVPNTDDCLPCPDWPRLNLHWLPRNGRELGVQLVKAAQQTNLPDYALLQENKRQKPISNDEILWDSEPPVKDSEFYAWIAGETSVIRTIRLTLTQKRNLDRTRLNFMGYWRCE